jgi:hypothetical protein
VRLASVAENAFNAVERISEFCDLPQEAPEAIPGSKPDDWPDQGRVGASPSNMLLADLICMESRKELYLWCPRVPHAHRSRCRLTAP